jgi:uncharacterized protein
MKRKVKSLKDQLAVLGKTLVAYSGGVDSTLLAKISREVLGDDLTAVIVISPTLPQRELSDAREIAKQMGFNLIEMVSQEMDLPDFIANTDQRCYFCKDHRYQHLKDFAEKNNYQTILDGSNADDLQDFRPGQKAARKHAVRSPLQEVGLTKRDIRKLARELGLPNWDKPSSACLASRIPYGEPIQVGLLKQIEDAEDMLFQLGFRQFRVRHHGDVARIEIPPDEFDFLLSHREKISERFEKIGYAYIALDIKGFRSGSLNEGLTHHGPTQDH